LRVAVLLEGDAKMELRPLRLSFLPLPALGFHVGLLPDPFPGRHRCAREVSHLIPSNVVNVLAKYYEGSGKKRQEYKLDCD
jgi:hypothetical protein